MKMMNRAIEDAADASEFIKKLQERHVEESRAVHSMQGETRTQRRARERAERKAALKAQTKVRTW